ncbi:alpha/beta hydrolase [Flavobacterium hercynium]|uniref:Esterase n=1 Tax=Flavobacterium hercynium TaxID=387094 RepID=A0A226H5Q8_9FLAO|nr:alpha/beta fold hydrolase [Flavobacterium hercynium]OXA89545.1 esterase [Flavobacterium hercynium]SMP35851.1 phospholipase/carboxylesterase [Flavobacterium hercynium]
MIPKQKPALHYIVRHPKIQSQKPPLLILMHGVGGNEQNMFSFVNALPDHFLVVSARGPITLGANSFAWFQVQFTAAGSVINEVQAESSRKEILKFIEDLKTIESFDENQVYLMGFSQGGIMSYSVALTEPEKIAGIAVMSGRLLPEIKPVVADKSRLKKLKIFISHGTHDSVLKFQYALDAQDYLKSKELNPNFHQYSEDHTINPAMLNDVINWILKQ